jgi:hypothetical protein
VARVSDRLGIPVRWRGSYHGSECGGIDPANKGPGERIKPNATEKW